MTIELQNAVSRRSVLKGLAGATGLVVAWSSRAGAQSATPVAKPATTPAPAAAGFPARQAPTDVDSYLSIDSDGTVRLAVGKVEFGQGIETGFRQIVAEELYLPFESVKIVMGITNQVPYDGATVGSQSTRSTGINIRKAAAEMAGWIKELAAEALSTTADKISLKDGSAFVTADPTQTTDFATLALGKRAVRSFSDTTVLKSPGDYTVVGQSIPRVDVPFKVNGAMKYGYDATMDGYVHGKVVRPTAIGAKLLDIDFSEAEKVDGFVGSFRDGDFAGIAATSRYQAEAALAAVKATWSEVNTGNTSENIHDLIVKTARDGVVAEEKPGDPDSVIAKAPTTFQATYTAPYVSHTPIEPKASLVSVTDDGVTVLATTQAPFRIQEDLANLLQIPEESVVVTPLMSGGAFGSKSGSVQDQEAARLSKAFGVPVRVQWTRQEEIMFGAFRPASKGNVSAALDANGNLTAWKYDIYFAGYYPEGAEKPTSSSGDAGYDINAIYPGGIPQTKATSYQGDSPLLPAHWRGNGTSYTHWAIESSLDELAELAKKDPVAFRRPLLANAPRAAAVMDKVVEISGYKPAVPGSGAGYGLALGFADGTWVAEVAKVSVDKDSGVITLHDVWAVVDCGLVINPDAVKCQVEGSIVLSLSAAMAEGVKFDNGKVTNNTWGTYKPITIMDVPTITVDFVEDKSQPMQGIGEPAVAPAPAAVANAVYDAAGIRLREMPFTSSNVLNLLSAKK